MTEHGPAVSRLCIAAAGGAWPLRSVGESGEFYRLYLTTDPVDGAELAVAPLGLDEVSLVGDLIDALRQRVAARPGFRAPVLAAFHVGIVKLTDAGFGGTGIDRALSLVRDPAFTGSGRRSLAVAITAGLFGDLRAEGLPGDGWQPAPAAGAWLRRWEIAG